jgi:nucleotide-binding universal stress UspA family protein
VVGDRNSRVSDVLLGGVAHRIVHLAPCSVLLVR